MFDICFITSNNWYITIIINCFYHKIYEIINTSEETSEEFETGKERERAREHVCACVFANSLPSAEGAAATVSSQKKNNDFLDNIVFAYHKQTLEILFKY